MPYTNDPSYRYINPGKNSPGNGAQINLARKYKEFKDISLDFEPHPITNDLTIMRNVRAINYAMKNIILTVRGEVPFNNNFGSQIRNYLFEVTDAATAHLIKQEIEESITAFEPRVELLVEGDMYPTGVGAIRSSNQLDTELSKVEYVGNATINEYLGDRLDTAGVTVRIREDGNEFEVTIAYKIVGYEQVFVVNEILTPTR